MEKWLSSCLLLCLFGLLKELRPSEFFVTEFLTGWKNISLDEVYQVVFPVWTYSYLALLVVVFLVTDYLLYKPVVVAEGLCFIVTWCLLIWGDGILAMQGVEFLYAAASATQVAYSTYIYAQVPLEKFQIVTAYTKAALLTGRCFAGVLGQVLVNTGLCDFSSLNYISMSFVTAATLVACFLPAVSRSVYFHRAESRIQPGALLSGVQSEPATAAVQINLRDVDGNVRTNNLASVGRHIWSDFVSSFSSGYMLKWSLWWAFATCVYYQVLNYIQSLWETITPWESTVIHQNGSSTTSDVAPQIYNGVVEAVHTLLGALATLAIGYAPISWAVYGEVVMGVISLFQGVMLYLAGSANSLWVAYVTYIAYGVSYSILITIASSEVAKDLRQESYGLVFGINTFVALFFQTILTLVVSDKAGLALEIQTQFRIYGVYSFVLGGIFVLMAATTGVIRIKRRLH